MKVCIAEKPSVAREIAAILGANTKKNGYQEGNGYRVTWTFGHLCTLKEPHDYYSQWKRWSIQDLPMIPPRFGIKVIQNEGIEKQFKIIEELLSDAECVINCGDAGQEGEDDDGDRDPRDGLCQRGGGSGCVHGRGTDRGGRAAVADLPLGKPPHAAVCGVMPRFVSGAACVYHFDGTLGKALLDDGVAMRPLFQTALSGHPGLDPSLHLHRNNAIA